MRQTKTVLVPFYLERNSLSIQRSPTESRRRHEEKQAKAQELREKLMQEKAERLRELSKKASWAWKHFDV